MSQPELSLTEQQIRSRFAGDRSAALSLIEPLMELSDNSPTLILGYGGLQHAIRREMIPYFHVCGPKAEHEPIRALLIGGWAGGESLTTYTLALLISAIERRLKLVAGIEVTAYPVANLEAHHAGVVLTSKQEIEGVQLWKDSTCTHVQVLEREIRRYDYDLIVLLRESPLLAEVEINAWPGSSEQETIVGDALRRYAGDTPELSWKLNPQNPDFLRSFTPVPEARRQPAELVVGLPSRLADTDATNLGPGVLLTLIHALRQARAEGVL